MGKRKKKNYTTPKKIKHKHRKDKVADNGKINRLRRECPAEERGAGVFMAAHFDRQYCGKCGLTYVFNKPEEGGAAKPAAPKPAAAPAAAAAAPAKGKGKK